MSVVYSCSVFVYGGCIYILYGMYGMVCVICMCVIRYVVYVCGMFMICVVYVYMWPV